MMIFLKLDLRSLLLVLITFIGNAQVAGFDVVLIICALTFFTKSSSVTQDVRPKRWFVIFFVLLLLGVALRSIFLDIPYFNDYYLWPLKAMFLTFLIGTSKELTWPLGNMIALTFLSVALIWVGRIEDGRMYSVFGPNMLYRLFGLVMMYGAMLFMLRRGKERIVMLGAFGFGFLASLATGSVGAVAIIVAVIALFAFRMSTRLSLVLGLTCMYPLLTLDFSIFSEALGVQELAAINRIDIKSASLLQDARIIGWGDILSQPFSPRGYDYQDFLYLWTDAYAYPHNLFVELFGFYGLLGVTLCLVVIVALVRAVPKAIEGEIISMTLIVLGLGSAVSGDLSDNYGVIGLACGLLLRLRSKRTIIPHGPSVKQYNRSLSGTSQGHGI